MRFAVLSDIHGNQYAMQAVINEIKERNIKNFILLGDYLGYYYGAKKVIDTIQKYSILAIKGNHEVLLESALHNDKLMEDITSKYGHGHKIAVQTLTETDLNFLNALPVTLELNLNKLKILLCHGTPWDLNEYLYPDATEKLLKRFNEYNYDYIFHGHTHYCSEHILDNKIIINPGSVGQSRQKGGVAYWGIFDSLMNKFEFCQTAYDTYHLKEEVKHFDPLIKYNNQILER